MRCFIAILSLVCGGWARAESVAAVTLSDAAIDELGGEIVRRCPATDSGDGKASRDACASALAGLRQLDASVINGTLRWGGMKNDDFEPTHSSLTVLSSLVWRKLYLSLYAFTGSHALEVLPDESRLLRLDAHLRWLDNAEFPYPFWHSRSKWRSYQQASQVALLFRGGKLVAAYRNAKLDPNTPARDETWNGLWTTDAGHDTPRTALFDYLLSADNPYTRRLDTAYKFMALEARQFHCESCHNPANPVSMNPLLIFNLPSQALSGRHQIVYVLEHNEMPPKQGIGDLAQRRKLMKLAQQFALIGDRALSFETQRTGAAPPAQASNH